MATKELAEIRKQMFDEMEQKLRKGQSPEDSLFYFHSSEDRIVLSHALFWVMTQSIRGQIVKERYFILLRKYEEEMLDAYLTEDDQFPELLRYCNIIYETLPMILQRAQDSTIGKDARKLAAISIVAVGYGGDMPEAQCNELLDDMDYHFNKLKCRKIEQMLPLLNKMVEDEVN